MRIKLLLIFLSASLLLGFFNPKPVSAQESIKNFAVSLTAHKDGTMSIKETIQYDFDSASRHGINRNIPLISRVGDLYRITSINVVEVLRDNGPENYSSSIDNSQISIKIGRSNVNLTGLHTYTISYVVANGIGSNYEDHDEIYWNVTGNNWNTSILKVSAQLTTDFGVLPDKAICYAGPQGSTLQNCDYSRISPITTTTPLGSNEGLTAVWSFPKNTFPPSILQKESRPSASGDDSKMAKILAISFWAVPIFLNLILAPGLLVWYFKTKRKERFGPATVSFDIPEDKNGKRLAPAETGSIDVHQVDQNDVVATIFDLAIRKYIKIQQVKNKKTLGIFGGGDDYIFTKLKDIHQETEEFEKVLLQRLFSAGDTAILSSLKTDFYKTFQEIEKEIFTSHVKRGFYSKNPKAQMALLLVLGIMVLFLGGLALGPVLIYLSRKLNGRTALGDETDRKIDGLKIFLKNMSRNYTWQAKNLYIVEKLIPYAIAFGFIKEFMEQLKNIYPNYNPTWYSGQLNFYAAGSNMFYSMSSSFTSRAPSSSSGFSGGGSSGGGGGGGGGGSW